MINKFFFFNNMENNNNVWENFKKIKLISSYYFGNLYYAKRKDTNIHILIQSVNKKKFSPFNKSKDEIEKIFKLYSNIEIYDIIDNKNYYYLILKNYLIDLENYLQKRDKPFTKNEIRDIFLQLNQKLQEIKQNNISLKNLKLSNIILCLDDINKISIKINYFNNYITENNNQINTTSGILEGQTQKTPLDNYDIQDLGILIYYLLFDKENLIENINKNNLKLANDKLLDELIQKMLSLTITWEQFFDHSFFKEYPEYNLLCKIHSEYVTFYCINCKKNICEKCIDGEQKSHQLISLSQIGFSQEEKNVMIELMKEIDNHIIDIKLIKNNIECFYNQLKKFDKNINYSNEKEYNFKDFLFECLNYLNYNTKINGIDKLRNNLIEFNLPKNEIEKINKNYKQLIGSTHSSIVRTIATFPSGNIIAGFNDTTIKIFDIQFSKIQIINAHEKKLLSIVVKDENNFISCSSDNKIITWVRNMNNNKYEKNQIIENVHEINKEKQILFKVIYGISNSLISCSNDTTIKIWDEDKNDNNKYKCIKTLKNSDIIYSIILLEDKNLLISCGDNGTNFWDISNDYYLLSHLKNSGCNSREALKRIDDDTIICGGSGKDGLKIVNISEKKVIKSIKIDFACLAIYIIKNKNAILTGGVDNFNINIYHSKDYSLLLQIQNGHNDQIYCFIELKNGCFASCSADKTIRVWSI